MAEEERATRDMETRETEKRAKTWKPAPLLPQPNPREGLDFRYVRASMRGETDNINVSQALRDGWEPVVSKDYPELMVTSDRGSQYPENVLIGGLLLCARPTEIGDEQKRLASEEVKQQVEGVDRSYFREQDSRMPMMSDKKSRITFGDN
jgi:hypothetical protein